MKKILKKIICCMMFTILFSTVSINAASINEKVGFDTLEESLRHEFGDNYEEFLENNAYEVEVAQKVENVFKENYRDKYPEYYGGMYITDDSTNLMIQIVKKNLPLKNTEDYKIYNSIINIDKSIQVEFVENSFNDLITAQEMISDNLLQDGNFNSMGVDVINNKIVVELIDNSLEKQKKFEFGALRANSCTKGRANYNAYLDFSLVYFKKGENNYTHALNKLNPGNGFTVLGTGCSVGYRTKYKGVNGFVTAGHCFIVDGVDTNLPFGNVVTYQFKNNEKYDYAFVATNVKYEVTNSIAYSTGTLPLTLSSTPKTPTVGMAVSKSGQTSKITSGKVTEINKETYFDNTMVTIKGLVNSSIKSEAGDSGGIIFYSTSLTKATPVGILSGGGSNNTHFTSINSLPSDFRSGMY